MVDLIKHQLVMKNYEILSMIDIAKRLQVIVLRIFIVHVEAILVIRHGVDGVRDGRCLFRLSTLL